MNREQYEYAKMRPRGGDEGMRKRRGAAMVICIHRVTPHHPKRTLVGRSDPLGGETDSGNMKSGDGVKGNSPGHLGYTLYPDCMGILGYGIVGSNQARGGAWGVPGVWKRGRRPGWVGHSLEGCGMCSVAHK